MDGHDDDLIRKTLRSLDFSKDNPRLKNRLSQELCNRGRILSDEELDFVSAASDPDAKNTAVRIKSKRRGETED